MTHTKGEWSYTTNALETPNDEAASIWRTHKIGGEIASTFIATISKSPGQKEANANAKLIAAAPELLEALDGLNTALDAYWNGDRADSLIKTISHFQKKSQSAIKKATT